jgi:hypothetical protein
VEPCLAYFGGGGGKPRDPFFTPFRRAAFRAPPFLREAPDFFDRLTDRLADLPEERLPDDFLLAMKHLDNGAT